MTSGERAWVIGAGPAGLSAALGLARLGYQVRVSEARPRWAPRVCGAFLSAEAVSHLRTLGLESKARQRGAVPVRSVCLTAPSGVSTSVRLREGLAVRRQILEEVLLEAVKVQGVEVRWGERVEKRGQSLFVGDCPLFPNVVVAADGRFSKLRAPNNHPELVEGCKPYMLRQAQHDCRGWFGWNAEFDGVDQNAGELSLHFFPGGYVGVLTFAGGRSNVCGLAYQPSAGLRWECLHEQALEANPRLGRCLRNAVRSSEWRGVGPLPFGPYPKGNPSIFYAGDAAGVSDPFIGEGVARALAAGPMLMEALAAGDAVAEASERYAAAWKRRYGRRFFSGRLLRTVMGVTSISRVLFTGLMRAPLVLQRLAADFHH